jgi:hypothetical protein
LGYRTVACCGLPGTAARPDNISNAQKRRAIIADKRLLEYIRRLVGLLKEAAHVALSQVPWLLFFLRFSANHLRAATGKRTEPACEAESSPALLCLQETMAAIWKNAVTSERPKTAAGYPQLGLFRNSQSATRKRKSHAQFCTRNSGH